MQRPSARPVPPVPAGPSTAGRPGPEPPLRIDTPSAPCTAARHRAPEPDPRAGTPTAAPRRGVGPRHRGHGHRALHRAGGR